MKNIYNCSGHKSIIKDVVNTEGIFIITKEGKRYMDLESGVWCTSLGHKNQELNSVIKSQMDSTIHSGFCYSSEVIDCAADSVLSITGFKEGKCVFLCSGSEAIELSRQISKHLTEGKQSMTLKDSYLGSYSSVIQRSEGWYLFDWQECKRCPSRGNCKWDCEKLKRIPSNISEFIFEPGSSSGFVRFPPKSLIQNIVSRIRKNGGKIVVNEVTTGVGRTGKWFGFHHYDIEPDLIAIGKGIGNGYPVSVTAINSKTVEELNRNPFKYAQSHQNDPLGAAVVKEVIRIINDRNLIAEAAIKGERFLELLKSLEGDIVKEVRGRGLMFGLDILNMDLGDQIYKELIKEGYIVCNRNSLFRIDPPLIISEIQFQQFIKSFKSILKKFS